MNASTRGHDRPKATLAMAVAALMMAHQVAGKAARDAIFLSQFRASDLPGMVAVAAMAAIAISVARGRTFVRRGPYQITALSFALSGCLHGAEWLLLGSWPRIAACAIYLHVVAFGAVLLSGFWSVMNESYEPRSAKSLFGTISGMGTLGGLLGGLFAERVAAWSSPTDVVLLLATLHIACAGLLWRGFATHEHPKLKHAHNAEERGTVERQGEANPIRALQRYPFLLTLAALVITASAATALLDFVFKAQAAHAIGRGAPLLRFFGLYYTATSLLTFLIQTLLTTYIVQRTGLAVCVGSLPAMTTVGSALAVVFPGFTFLSGVRAEEIILRGSLYRSAYELFYTAVAPGDKRAVKSLVDVGFDRGGDALGAAGVSLLLLLMPGRYAPVLAAACVLSAIATLIAVRLRPGYVHALERSLVERAIEIDPSLADDSATRSGFMRSIVMPSVILPSGSPTVHPRPPALADSFISRAAELRSGAAERAARVAAQLAPADWALAPLLINLLAWDEAMPAAQAALERMGPRITGMLVDALLDPERDIVVRRRVPRVLACVPSMRSVDGLLAALDDQRFEVRFYAARAVYLLAREHPDLTIPPDRVWAAINRELSQQRSMWNSHRLLDRRGSSDKQWFFDDELQDRADHNLEHLFTLLELLLPGDAVRIAFRALHTDDNRLKGTAFEYLESATPADTRRLLLPLLEMDAQTRRSAAERAQTPIREKIAAASPGGGKQDAALRNLLAGRARINQTLKLEPLQAEVR